MRNLTLSAAVAATLALASCAEPIPSPAESRGDASAVRGQPGDERDPYGLLQLVDVMSMPAPPRETTISGDLRVRLVGKGRLTDESPEMPVDFKVSPVRRGEINKEPPAPEAFSGGGRLRVFNGVTLNEFQVVVNDRLLDAISALRKAAGLTSATEGVENPDALEDIGRTPTPASVSSATTPIAYGWSNGVDSRVLLTGTTTWPWRTISQFTYGGADSRCTGTLIGPRHVITAAHCIVKQGTDQWYAVTVAPGHNLTQNPYGTSTVTTTPAPGTEVWYFTPWQWRDSAATSSVYDWGLLVIPDRLGDKTGWMGYVAESFSFLSGKSQYNRGYPSCDPTFAEKPANCQTGGLYGDVKVCSMGGVASPGPDGWNRLISLSCDLSRGHSGSAVYHYDFDPALNMNVPVVAMMVRSHTCLTCTPADTFPNWARRITPKDLDVISWLRQTFP